MEFNREMISDAGDLREHEFEGHELYISLLTIVQSGGARPIGELGSTLWDSIN